LNQFSCELLVLVPKPQWLILSLQDILNFFHHLVAAGLH
jgi:hypothetical protein